MAYYVKVTMQVAKKLGHSEFRNTTADGNKLLWQADLNTIEGETIFDRAAKVGGVCLTAQQAKAEIDGCDHPAEVYTPDKYKDPEPTPPAEGDVSVDVPKEEPSVEESPQEQAQSQDELSKEELPKTEEQLNDTTIEQPAEEQKGDAV